MCCSLNSIVHYEYGHNPDLFNHTRVGKIEQMRKTMQEGGSLSQAGKSAVEFNKTGMSGAASTTSKALATSHWKTMYQQTAEET